MANPQNLGELPDADAVGTVGNSECGELLRTFNCPYHELAHEHREICEMDTNMMRKVLGSDVSLSSCMLDGHAGYGAGRMFSCKRSSNIRTLRDPPGPRER